VVFVKRGCGLTMPNTQPAVEEGAQPAPWCLSGFDDLKLAIDHVARECPGIPICGLGLSTGAGQLRNYVCRTGKECKLNAAVLLDAAPEWGSALESCDERVPLISQALNMGISETFKACGYQAKPKAVADASEQVVPGGMLEFMRDVMGPAHGFERSVEGARQYMRSCQPAHVSNCAIPVLELTTTNDTLCTAEMSQRVASMYKASPHVVTAMTQQGTHMVRWEGWLPQCWTTRVSGEFFESILHAAATPTCTTMKSAKVTAPALSSGPCGQGMKARPRKGSISQ